MNKSVTIDANQTPTDGWNRDSHEMKRDAYGVWEIVLPAQNGQPAIVHDSKVKV